MKRIALILLTIILTFTMVFGFVVNAKAAKNNGDINGDNKVNAEDAVYLLYHVIFGGEKYSTNENPDVNNDGKKNKDDAIYLLYHTLIGGSKYPLYPAKTPETNEGDNWSPDVI